MSGNPKPAGRNRRKIPPWLLLGYALLMLAVIAAGALLGTLLGYEFNLPRIQSLEDFRPDVISDVFSDDNRVIGEFAIERRIVVTLDEIPHYLQLAIIAAEDDQFYHHGGVNYISVLRAAYRNLVSMRKAEGFSTITMQLARMLLGTYEKTYDRKIKELLVARLIEKRYTKQQILTLYCNQHYMGQGAYGVAAAADTYFGKQLKDLTLDECAMIAALPRNPGLYSPRLRPEAARARRNYVLDRMVAERMIPPSLAAEAKARPIVLKPRSRDTEAAPYFVEWVRQSLAERYSTDDIWRKGLRIYTTLNPRLQEAAVSGVYLQDWLFYPTDYNWRLEPEQSGETRAVGDIGSHWLDLAEFISGCSVSELCADFATYHPVRRKPVKAMEAFAGKVASAADCQEVSVNTEDYAAVLLRFQGKARGSFAVNQVAAGRKNFLLMEVYGTKKALSWNSENPNELWIGRRDGNNELVIKDPSLLDPGIRAFADLPGGHGEGFDGSIKQTMRLIYSYIARDGLVKGEAPDFAVFADGLRELKLCEAIVRSARQRSWVAV